MTRTPPSRRPETTARRSSRLFEPLRIAFAKYLFRRGHPDRQRYTKVSEVRRFVRFLEAGGRKRLLPLSRTWARRYERHRLDELRERRGARSAANMGHHVRGALQAFYGFLETRGGVPHGQRSAAPRDPLDASTEGYLRFLRETRGFADCTVAFRQRPMKRFLRFVRRAGRRHPCEIDLSLVDAFFSQILSGRTHSFVYSHVLSVRGYLRYLFLTGVHPKDLASLVESPVSFRQARLPRTIGEKDIRRVLSEIDPGTPKGRRDRAMFLLLVALGLRPHEAALLRTKDVDLDRGSVLVPAAKSSPQRRVPLPPVLRSAIAQYLLRDRPADAPTDRLFLYMRAPWRPFRSGETLATILGRYFARAGLTERGLTVYALRHAFAQRLMERKVSLAVIRDLMGHRSISTTFLYLKVDLHHLREVARLPTVRRLAGLLLRDGSRTP